MGKLGTCRTCGKGVAENADKCPHCGQHTPIQDPQAVQVGFWLFIGCLLFVIYAFYTRLPSLNPKLAAVLVVIAIVLGIAFLGVAIQNVNIDDLEE